MKKMMLRSLTLLLALAAIAACLTGCLDLGETSGTQDNTVLQLFEELQDNDVMPFTITEKAREMLRKNEDLFLRNRNGGLAEYTDTSLEYKILSKNIDKHGDKLLFLSEAYVLQINETQLDDETTFSALHLVDVDGNSLYVMSLVAYDDIFEGDYVCAYALPLGETAFDNISGGTTLAIVLAGCYVEKIG